MKAAAVLILLAAIAIIFFVLNKDEPSDRGSSSTEANSQKGSSGDSSQSASAPDEKAGGPTKSDRKREITEVAKTGSWHPTQKGMLISPYNEEVLPAVGVVSGSKMKDASGKEFIVPPFKDSPFRIYPVGASIPDRPGYVFNPFTGNAVDVRGLPPGSLVRDPVNPDPEQTFRTPESK